jgi:hypothetical protein
MQFKNSELSFTGKRNDTSPLNRIRPYSLVAMPEISSPTSSPRSRFSRPSFIRVCRFLDRLPNMHVFSLAAETYRRSFQLGRETF